MSSTACTSYRPLRTGYGWRSEISRRAMTQENVINAGIFLLIALLGTALGIGVNGSRSARWLVNNGQDEVVTRRPMVCRLMAGFVTIVCLCLMACFLSLVISGSVASNASGWWAIAFLAVVLIVGTFSALFSAGPRRLSLDLQKRRYSFTQGFPLLSWTKHGQVDGGELSLNRVKSGPWQVRFRAPGWKFGLPLEVYMTEGDARALAWHLASELGLSVRPEIY